MEVQVGCKDSASSSGAHPCPARRPISQVLEVSLSSSLALESDQSFISYAKRMLKSRYDDLHRCNVNTKTQDADQLVHKLAP